MAYRRELIQIRPTNLGNGVFGSRAGLPQIIFEIPQVPKICNGKSLKISGKFKAQASTGVAPNNASQFFQQVAANTDNVVYMDGRTGISSCFDVVSIQSLSNGQTYENIKNYNRLCSSIMPLNESIKSYLNGGIDGLYGGLSKEVSTAAKCDKQFSFATPLWCGFLQGSPIDLNLVGGIRIVISLSPDNFVLRNNKWRFATNQGGQANGGAFYELSDMMLTFEAEVPDAEGQEAMMSNMNGAWEYNAYSSFYNVIQSNDHSAILNINTGRTIATIANIIPSSFLNNYNYNSSWATQLLTEDTAGTLKNRITMTDFTLTKGGLRIPLDFEVDSEDSQKNGTCSSAKNFEELNAIRPVWSLSNFEKSPTTELSLALGNVVAAGQAQDQARHSLQEQYSVCLEDKIKCDNFGVAYDHITNNGLNFKGTPLGLRIQSVAPTGTSMKPHSLFLYIKHKNTIVFNNGLVNVVS